MKMMMMAMTALWAAVLLPHGVSGGLMSFLFGHSLDMALDSVDDMYNGCSSKMEANAKSYLQAEMKDDPVLKKSWMDAQALQKEEPPAGMTKEQMIALYAYTSGEGDLKKQFNKANREQGLKNYKKGFKYHALHFYLSTAVQALKAEHDKSTEDNDKKCYTVFRRTDASFSKKVLKKEVRFGSFASASLNKDLVVSGDKSCFEVYTCMGADVSNHTLHEHKAEVLIPPYEVFKVKKITEKSEQPDLWCDVVYKLKSKTCFQFQLCSFSEISSMTFSRTGYKTCNVQDSGCNDSL